MENSDAFFLFNLSFSQQDLVRTRRYVKKFMLMRANIQAVSLKIQTLKSQSAMAKAMKGVTKAMGNMNKVKITLTKAVHFFSDLSFDLL